MTGTSALDIGDARTLKTAVPNPECSVGWTPPNYTRGRPSIPCRVFAFITIRLVVCLTVIKAKTRPGIKASFLLHIACICCIINLQTKKITISHSDQVSTSDNVAIGYATFFSYYRYIRLTLSFVFYNNSALQHRIYTIS